MLPLNICAWSFRFILIWIEDIRCILIYLRRLIIIHHIYFNIFDCAKRLYFSGREDFILKQVYILRKYRIVGLFISIAIKLICFLNLCLDNALFETRRVNTIRFAFLFIIPIFWNLIIILDFFLRSINILGLHKVYIG